jgi:6-phospho-beta-glucosidase
MKLKFPKDFLWGAATASEQSEGHGKTSKSKTVWDLFYEKHPSLFHNQVGPSITNDQTNNFKNEYKMLSDISFNSYRTGFSWARLFPDGRNVSKEAVSLYHEMINELKKHKIKVVMTLVHFDLPSFVQEKGGLASREFTDMFEVYADFIFEEFGNEVDMFVTFNEPVVPVIGGYIKKFHWPMVSDRKLAINAGFFTILAHAKVVNLFNNKYRNKIKAKIGVVCNVSPAIARESGIATDSDKKAAEMFDLLHNYSMLDPMIKGQFPKDLVNILKKKNLLPDYKKEDIQLIKNIKLDFIGINYYAPTRVIEPDINKFMKDQNDFFYEFFDFYSSKNVRMNVFRGWEIKPDTLLDIANLIKNRYNNIPWYISENGMGVQNEELYRNKITGQIDDDYRIAFVHEHLYYLHSAIQSGANCFGYHMWCAVDCWSWLNAYKNRYGFIELDLKTQSRKFKKSSYWFKNVIISNSIEDKFDKIEKYMDLNTVRYEKSNNMDSKDGE